MHTHSWSFCVCIRLTPHTTPSSRGGVRSAGSCCSGIALATTAQWTAMAMHAAKVQAALLLPCDASVSNVGRLAPEIAAHRGAVARRVGRLAPGLSVPVSAEAETVLVAAPETTADRNAKALGVGLVLVCPAALTPKLPKGAEVFSAAPTAPAATAHNIARCTSVRTAAWAITVD